MRRSVRVPHRKKIAQWFWVFLVLLCLAAPPREEAVAEEASWSFEEAYLRQLINELRLHPLETLQKLSIDPGSAREALGDDGWVVDAGLPPLASNAALAQAALKHLEDMVNQLYYGHWAPDGTGPWERALREGYEAVVIEEGLGLLGVITFVDGPEAARTVFSQWILTELNPAGTEARRLLSPRFSDVGIAFRPVSVTLDGIAYNFYVAVAVYAYPPVFAPFLVGAVRGGGNPGPLGIPETPSPWADYPVVCIDASGWISGVAVVDPAGGFQCPMDSGRAVAEIVDPKTGAVIGRAEGWGLDAHAGADVLIDD